MSLFAVADLHLPGGDDKPMNVFGTHWDNHFARISESWRSQVGEQDTVLIAGDVSWAMQLQDAIPDLQSIGALPGRKIIIRGNHDYWWSSIGKVRSVLPEGMMALQQSAVDLGDVVVCGTRGWTYPSRGSSLPESDEKIFRRELLRLEMALQDAVRLAQGKPIVVMLHYPPLYANDRNTPFTALLEQYPVHTVVYGHLHAESASLGYTGEQAGIFYHLTACDALGFRVLPIGLGTQEKNINNCVI